MEYLIKYLITGRWIGRVFAQGYFCYCGRKIVASLEPVDPQNLRYKNFDFVDQNLSKFDNFGVVGKLRLRSIQIWQK